MEGGATQLEGHQGRGEEEEEEEREKGDKTRDCLPEELGRVWRRCLRRWPAGRWRERGWLAPPGQGEVSPPLKEETSCEPLSQFNRFFAVLGSLNFQKNLLCKNFRL